MTDLGILKQLIANKHVSNIMANPDQYENPQRIREMLENPSFASNVILEGGDLEGNQRTFSFMYSEEVGEGVSDLLTGENQKFTLADLVTNLDVWVDVPVEEEGHEPTPGTTQLVLLPGADGEIQAQLEVDFSAIEEDSSVKDVVVALLKGKLVATEEGVYPDGKEYSLEANTTIEGDLETGFAAKIELFGIQGTIRIVDTSEEVVPTPQEFTAPELDLGDLTDGLQPMPGE